jgi:hypothetical protein
MKKGLATAILTSGALMFGALHKAIAQRTATSERVESPTSTSILRSPIPTKGTIVRTADTETNTRIQPPDRLDFACTVDLWYTSVGRGGIWGLQKVQYWDSLTNGATVKALEWSSFGPLEGGGERNVYAEVWLKNTGTVTKYLPNWSWSVTEDGKQVVGGPGFSQSLAPGEKMLGGQYKLSSHGDFWPLVTSHRFRAHGQISTLMGEADMTNNECYSTFYVAPQSY